MSGLEAAASLFGPEDASSDPFASLGSESSTPVTNTTHEAKSKLFTENDASSTGNFLETVSDSHNVGSMHETAFQQPGQNTTWSGTAQDYVYDPTFQNVNAGNAYNAVNQEPGEQWSNYSQPSYEPDIAAPTFTPENVPANPYDPYAPSYHQPATQKQPGYNMSTAVPTSQSNYYTPSQSAVSSQPAYNSYTPQTSLAYGSPSYTTAAQSPYALQDTTSVPPPPAPKVPLNRPKVSNAYDPPFPTTTRKSTARATLISPPVFRHNTSASPPLAPPPSHALASDVYTSHSPPHSSPYQNTLSHYTSSSGAYSTPVATSTQHNSAFAIATSVAEGLTFNDGSSHGTINANPYSSVPSGHEQADHGHVYGSHTFEIDGTSAESTPDLFSQPESGKYLSDASFSANIDLELTHSERIRDAVESSGFWPSTESTGPPQSSPAAPDSNSPGASSSTPLPKQMSPANYISMYTPLADSGKAAVDRTSPPNSISQDAAVHGSPVASVHSARSGTSDFSSPPTPPMAPPKRTSSVASTRSYRAQSPMAPLSGGSDTYRPRSSNSGPRVSSPTVNPSNAIDLYAPKVNQIPEDRVPSPPIIPMNGTYNVNPYLPSGKPPSVSRNRSMSNGSVLSSKSEDPYGPLNHSRLQSSDSDHGSYTSRYDYPNNEQIPLNPGPSLGVAPPQDILMKTHTPYAPSPSLLGTNDPLGRSGIRMPVFSFGFGGKIVSCFHGADKMNTGFDVALASRNSTGVEIRTLNKVIPESALNASSAMFPGPLFSDPGTPTNSLVRTGVTSQMKTKKARITKYLTERSDEISQGIGYLHSGSLEQGRTESKLVLIKLLKIMVENDGRLSGTPSIDAAVRVALVPHVKINGSDSDLLNPSGFTSIADLQGSAMDSSSTDPHEPPIAVTTLRPAALNKIQDFLLRGERRQAYHYALDQKLWAHAMVISSGIDKEAWKEVVNEFLKTELGVSSASASSMQTSSTSVNGRESLRVAYSLFSGQGAGAVQQLVPQTSLSKPNALLSLPTVSHTTPMTPNFAVPMPAASIPLESLSKWAETVAMMISGTASPETSAALTALGDQLAGNGRIEAAHVCHLLSPQTSPIAGPGLPSARIILLGAHNPLQGFSNDPDPIIFSEILEFALSLAPVSKGQEPFGGLPHLQAYRFIRAAYLAEVGDIPVANRYCEAVSAAMMRGSPYFTNTLVEQLKGLSDRIVGVTHADKPGTWIGGKLSKPSLDSIGGWLEGRFAKLVTGDMDNDTATEEDSKKNDDRGFVGPFSQYSTISSTTTSTSPSPQASVVNLNAYAPPPRTGSSLSTRSTLSISSPADRASSAIDHTRQKVLQGPRVASAGPGATTFAQSRSFGQALSSYSPMTDNEVLTPRPFLESTEDEGQEVMWWGSNAGVTPTATAFVHVNDDSITTSSEGLISLIDNPTYSTETSSNIQDNYAVDEDEEDLGFGNSRPRHKPSLDIDAAHKTQVNTKPEPANSATAAARPAAQPASSSSGSWLSRWWKRESTPGPTKASLGEETSFYYDKELKRWVNKKAGAEDTIKSAAPPPPSRARTASPGVATARPPSADPTARPRPPSTGPPQRSASAIDLTSSPPEKPTMRIRSNLVPTSEAGSAPSTPTGSRLAPPGPPPGRPRSQASKRNVRSRYVDVFQQEGAA